MRSFGEALRLSMPAQPLPAPTFRLSDLTGQVFTLEELQGKIVFLNFWATWCPPCRAEMPGMEKLFQRMQGKDFVMLAINFQEGPEQVQEFIAQFQLHLPALLDTDGTVGTAYKVTGLPTTFILDRRGRIIASVIGPREWDSEASYAFFDHLLLHQ
jgi:thiol-disulfide isomerase/thioredoxin